MCLDLGRLPNTLREQITVDEFAAFYALHQVDPWGPSRQDVAQAFTTAAIQAMAGGGWHPDRFVYSALVDAADKLTAAEQAKRNREKFKALNVMLRPPGGRKRKRAS